MNPRSKPSIKKSIDKLPPERKETYFVSTDSVQEIKFNRSKRRAFGHNKRFVEVYDQNGRHLRTYVKNGGEYEEDPYF